MQRRRTQPVGSVARSEVAPDGGPSIASVAAESLDPVGEAPEPVAVDAGSPNPVIAYVDDQSILIDHDRHLCGMCVRVLLDVRECLGDDEVRGGLDLLRQPLAGYSDAASTGIGARSASASSAAREPALGQHGRMQPARELAEILEAGRQLVDRDRRAAASRSPTDLAQPADRQQDSRQPLLRAVVQVALDAPALGVRDLDEAGARGPQGVHRPACGP